MTGKGHERVRGAKSKPKPLDAILRTSDYLSNGPPPCLPARRRQAQAGFAGVTSLAWAGPQSRRAGAPARDELLSEDVNEE